MEKFVINAKTRTETGKKYAKAIRAQGRIPAVAYNEKGESFLLEIEANEFEKAWRSITKTTLVTLNIDGKANNAYIKDCSYDIKTDKSYHADFHVVSGEKPIVATLKIRLVGTAAGVLKGGFMVKHVPEITVKALPQDMPEFIEADVSKVEIGQKLTFADLSLGDKVTVISNPASVIITIAPPKK